MKKKQKSVKRGKKDFVDFACRQILHVLPEFTDKFQQAYSENGFYPPVENRDWTTGFWTGEIWLAYEFCGDERLKKAGEIQVHDFLERIDKKISVDHHDMGFLYSPSCVAAYKLIGSKEGREAAIRAADQLITRYHAKGEFIQAWGAMDEPGNYRLIIDCLLNLPLLYWASGETGAPDHGATCQGYRDGSAWARGQAWGDYFYMEALTRMEKDWTLYW